MAGKQSFASRHRITRGRVTEQSDDYRDGTNTDMHLPIKFGPSVNWPIQAPGGDVLSPLRQTLGLRTKPCLQGGTALEHRHQQCHHDTEHKDCHNQQHNWFQQSHEEVKPSERRLL